MLPPSVFTLFLFESHYCYKLGKYYINFSSFFIFYLPISFFHRLKAEETIVNKDYIYNLQLV